MSDMPGGGVAKRPLHFFILADCSGSMIEGGKIQALNAAIEELLPHLAQASLDNFHADIRVRALAFSRGCTWHVGTPTDPSQIRWPALRASGRTDLGAALRELATQLNSPPMDQRAFPPAVVLVSDGQPTDDFAAGLAAFEASMWGPKSQRFAIAIGSDADRAVLTRFVNDPEIPILEARNAEQLKDLLQFVSTAAVGGSILGGGKVDLPPLSPELAHLGDTWL
jgi:uncharacterized protein YegL